MSVHSDIGLGPGFAYHEAYLDSLEDKFKSLNFKINPAFHPSEVDILSFMWFIKCGSFGLDNQKMEAFSA